MPILILTDFFPPGFRAGGPVRSCLNLAIGLSTYIPVKVLTRDTEWGDSTPYTDIHADQWQSFTSNVSVHYASVQQRRFASIKQQIRVTKSSVFYLNGMFSIPFTIYPILAHWLGQIKGCLVLAPRGMLKDSALQFKPLKKRIFLSLFRVLGWHKRIVFHATSQEEANDVFRVFGKQTQVIICPQVPEISLFTKRTIHHKKSGALHLCLVGRLHPIKQVHLAIEVLGKIRAHDVCLDIIGPAEDVAYTAICKQAVDALPSNIQVRFRGEMPAEQAHEILAECDFFYLLTQGENFGHAIFEALALGKPVIISDQTPWRNLETTQAGWDLPLQNLENILIALNKAASMDDNTYQVWSDGAFACARKYVDESNWLESYMNMFFPDGISANYNTN